MAPARPTTATAQTYEEKGDFARAADEYAAYLAATPADAAAWLKLASLRERLGEGPAAAQAFRRHAELQAESGFSSKAISAYRQALRLAPGDAGIAVALSGLLADEGKQRDALEALEAAGRAAAERGDQKTRVEMLGRLADLDRGAPAALAYAEALAGQGRKEEAAERLERVVHALREQRAFADQLLVMERLISLRPHDRQVALRAGRVALVLRDPRRALAAIRTALDHAPDDADLASMAASALDAMDERLRGALVHGEAARRYLREERPSLAEDQWRAVLAFNPRDEEALAALRGPVSEATSGAGAEAEAPGAEPWTLDEEERAIRSAPWAPRATEGAQEADSVIAPLAVGAPPAASLPDEFVLEISPDELAAAASIELDTSPARPDFPDDSLLAASADAAVLGDAELRAPEDSHGAGPAGSPTPAPQPAATRAGAEPAAAARAIAAALPEAPRPDEDRPEEPVRPAPTRALVVGDGPEAGWAERALVDLGLSVTVVGAGGLEGALEQASDSGCDLVFTPPSLAEGWREAGGWLVCGPIALPRGEARARLRAAGVPCITSRPARSAGEVRAAMEAGWAPLELAGPFGDPLVVPVTGNPAYSLTLARSRLGPELEAQPVPTARVRVLLAADGRRTTVLADWQEQPGEETRLLESPAPEADPGRTLLAERIARALGFKGLGVMVLAQLPEGWVFEAMEPAWGAGGLAAEMRTGLALVQLAVGLARGEAAPEEPAARGVALAATVPQANLSSVSNLRVEPAADGSVALVCAQAPDRAQALRRLARALGKKA